MSIRLGSEVSWRVKLFTEGWQCWNPSEGVNVGAFEEYMYEKDLGMCMALYSSVQYAHIYSLYVVYSDKSQLPANSQVRCCSGAADDTSTSYGTCPF